MQYRKGKERAREIAVNIQLQSAAKLSIQFIHCLG